ncbi:hypothetical protein J500_0029 [Acinetobacter sp. 479375]|nr:hypothetical protein J500_0029 [Acinetobacter sp. 479375]
MQAQFAFLKWFDNVFKSLIYIKAAQSFEKNHLNLNLSK